MVWEALKAKKVLAEKNINAEIINIHTIKPLDKEAVIASAQKTGCVVTAEEHMILGGLGESIAQVLGRNLPTPLEMVAVDDSFGESGKPVDLMKKYGLNSENIVIAAEKAVLRK